MLEKGQLFGLRVISIYKKKFFHFLGGFAGIARLVALYRWAWAFRGGGIVIITSKNQKSTLSALFLSFFSCFLQKKACFGIVFVDRDMRYAR